MWALSFWVSVTARSGPSCQQLRLRSLACAILEPFSTPLVLQAPQGHTSYPFVLPDTCTIGKRNGSTGTRNLVTMTHTRVTGPAASVSLSSSSLAYAHSGVQFACGCLCEPNAFTRSSTIVTQEQGIDGFIDWLISPNQETYRSRGQMELGED